MITGPLKADGRLAAKNATKIRAALAQVTNFKSVFNRYQETQPQATDDKAKDRSRARAWLMLNVGFNNDALHNAIMHAWAEAYVLGQDAAGEWIRKAEKAQKFVSGMVDWDNWKPGDRATALLVKPVGGFQRYLEQAGGASYFKKFDKETIEMLGTSLADAIEAGLDSEAAALLIKNHVASPGRALTIAITEQNRAMSFSTIQRYKEAELQKMEWHVSDPCPKCAQNSGVVIEIGGTFPSGNQQPPAHPHCRCVLLPVIPGMEEDGGIGGTTTAPIVTSDGAIEQKPFAPTRTITNNTLQPMSPDKWIARQEAKQARNGRVLDEDRRKILLQQLKDNRLMFEQGPHVVFVRTQATKVTEDHIQQLMGEVNQALEKLPEWRKYDENGVERGYAFVIDKFADSNTSAYTYKGTDTIFISAETVINVGKPFNGNINWHMPAAQSVSQSLYDITHELGHTMDTRENADSSNKLFKAASRKVPKMMSGYAKTEYNEAYAEVYTQWALGEQNALTNAYAEKFGWNLTAAQYKEKMKTQWQPAFTSTL